MSNDEKPQVEVRERTPRIKDQAEGAHAKSDELHTHWARCEGIRGQQRVNQLKAQGYRPATEKDVASHDGYVKSEDGTIRKGQDLLLMVGPREAMEQRETERARRNIESDRRATEAEDRANEFYTDKGRHHQESRNKKYYIP